LSRELEDIAREAFLVTAGPSLVREVARTLAAHRISVMPLKGVLLQRMVFGEGVFRPISDVDILVAPGRFEEAHAVLISAGFEHVFWERGKWQATLKNPSGFPLGIDLHREVSRTPRSRLTPRGLFERGTTNESLFGVAVRVPSPDDLFAHVLLHGMLHWIRVGRVHHPGDLAAIATRLGLNPEECAQHLARLNLTVHALTLLPLILQKVESTQVRKVLVASGARSHLRERYTSRTISALLSRPNPSGISRRLAGLSLAPSLLEAIELGLADRVRSMDLDVPPPTDH
jgi:hypothetical protein